MIGDLLDSPWKIAIIALVILVLFGSKKLPSAARSLGQSMRILKKEVHGLHEDEPESRPSDAQALTQAPTEITTSASAQRAQIDALQQQLRDLQRAAATDAATKTRAAAAAEACRPARQPV
jgi:sec-independent protein translocase protein TatA